VKKITNSDANRDEKYGAIEKDDAHEPKTLV